MSRGMLDEADVERISQETPGLSNLQQIVTSFSPAFISISFPYKSNIPIASGCLQDAVHTLAEARYALFEALAHQVWYRQKKEPPKEMTAAFFGRYYAADAALRLYSAGEHLANGIIMMLEITDEDLNPYKKKRISQQSIVGYFLKKQEAHHPITKAVIRLAVSKEWQATMTYRNKWVHEQPPTVAEMGIVYKRGKRWKPLPNGRYTLEIGGGDKPEYSAEDLVGFIKPAMFKFTDTFTSVVEFYTDLLKDAGKRTNQPLDRSEQ